MESVIVTPNNCRINLAEATCNWATICGGPGLGLEGDFFFQGCSSISRRGQTGTSGVSYCDPCTTNLSSCQINHTVMFKLITTTPGLLDACFCCCPFAAQIGSGTGAYYQWCLHTACTYPSRTSWLVIPIDPNVVSHRSSTTGCPVLACADYYGFLTNMASQSVTANNGIDAIDVGVGLTLTRGDGIDADGSWCRFIDRDEGCPSCGRFGYVTTLCCILFVFGKMVIGECSNATWKTIKTRLLINRS